MNKLNIAIVEDDPIFCKSIGRALIDIEIVDKFKCFKSAEKALAEKFLINSDLSFIDLKLPKMDGIQLINEMNKLEYRGKIIIATALDSEEKIFNGLKAGAVGYLLKNEMDNLSNVIDTVISGGGILSPTIAIRLASFFYNSNQFKNEETISDREKQVLDLVIAGEKDESISKILGITIATVRFHIGNLFKKLHVKNRIQLANKGRGF